MTSRAPMTRKMSGLTSLMMQTATKTVQVPSRSDSSGPVVVSACPFTCPPLLPSCSMSQTLGPQPDP